MFTNFNLFSVHIFFSLDFLKTNHLLAMIFCFNINGTFRGSEQNHIYIMICIYCGGNV